MSPERLSSSLPILFLLLTFAAWPSLAGQLPNPEVEPYLREGIESVRRNNFQEAEKFLRLALARQQSPFAYYWLGVAYLKEHQPVESERALLKAIEIRPNFPEAYDMLGVLYDTQKLYSKSEPAFLHALALNSRETNALFNLGVS